MTDRESRGRKKNHAVTFIFHCVYICFGGFWGRRGDRGCVNTSKNVCGDACVLTICVLISKHIRCAERKTTNIREEASVAGETQSEGSAGNEVGGTLL